MEIHFLFAQKRVKFEFFKLFHPYVICIVRPSKCRYYSQNKNVFLQPSLGWMSITNIICIYADISQACLNRRRHGGTYQ